MIVRLLRNVKLWIWKKRLGDWEVVRPWSYLERFAEAPESAASIADLHRQACEEFGPHYREMTHLLLTPRTIRAVRNQRIV